MNQRILCVCLGNICRSPTAEVILSDRLGPGFDLDSAGTGGWHVGKPPHPPAIAAALAAGYDISNLRARQVRADDFRDFDLILGMDDQNLHDLRSMAPPDATARIEKFTAHMPGRPDVPDPYFTGGFDDVIALLEQASQGWVDQLQARSAEVPKAR